MLQGLTRARSRRRVVNMGDSSAILVWTMLPMLISIGIAVFFIVLAVRLVRAVEKIAEKLR